ncbi:MAG TPA: HEPN domain-containing protein [Trebonia sp.]|jgi:hypothetical protein|nr:HEPN domain-containing protein [Trebonia sp.]
MEAFDADGVFWLPGKDAGQRTGRLTFDPAEGATLSIKGGFDNIQEQFNDQTRMRRIHGMAGGRYLTLDGCFSTGTNFEDGIHSQSYYVNRVITGNLFAESDDLAFDKCRVTFDQLAHWISRPAKVNFETQTIEFEPPQDETAHIGDREELRLTSQWTVGGDYITKTYLNQTTYLELEYPAARPLDNILGDAKYLQDLLTLATNAATAPLEITLWRADITRENQLPQRRPQEMKYYAGQLAERVRLDAPQSAGRILFEFSDIGGLPTIARWVNIARKYQIVVGSLLSIRYASGLYVENRFNNVISAAETFHRLRFSNQIRPKGEFRKFCRELVAAVPQDHKEWLHTQIRYANEPRLRDRLTGLATYAGDAFAGVYAEPEQWARVVTEIRNRLTHHDEKRAIRFETGDLYFLTESVFMLVMLCLFRECEMDDKALSAIAVSGSTRFLRSKLKPVIPRLYAEIGGK